MLIWVDISLDSVIKSLSANSSDTLYGNVFLIRFDFSILKSFWDNL